MTADLLWTCDKCQDLTGEDGFIILTGEEMNQALLCQEAQIASDVATHNEGGFRALSLIDLMSTPRSGEWTSLCKKHSLELPDSGYYFSIDRIQSYADALDWTLHLSEKNWFQFTNWTRFLRNRTTSRVDA